MDTVTEAELAIAIALEGGLGFIHKNMSIEKQAAQVRKVKRSQAGMILDPITLHIDSKVRDAETIMREYHIGGIPVVDGDKVLKGIITNRDLRFIKDQNRLIRDIMTRENLITAKSGISWNKLRKFFRNIKLKSFQSLMRSTNFRV